MQNGYFLERLADQLTSRYGERWVHVSKVCLFVTPLLGLAGYVALKLILPRPYYSRLVREDQPIEYLTALAYLAAFVIALSIAIRFFRRRQRVYGALYLFLSLFLLVVFLEEISWGQRIFSYASPEYFERANRQGETNIHNTVNYGLLVVVYTLITAYGAFAFLVLRRGAPARLGNTIDLLVPGWFLFFYFFIPLLSEVYFHYPDPWVAVFGEGARYGKGTTGPHFISTRDEEFVELNLGLAFLLFVAVNSWRQVLGRFDNRR